MNKINEARLWERLNTIGPMGSVTDGGVCRYSWEPPYKEAVNTIISWLKEAGLSYRIDTVGNLYGRLEGEDPNAPAILSGSHLDTVPHGGYFDGLAGIMAALESLVSIKESGVRHKRPLEMIAFINEEASQFLGSIWGSKAVCGMLPLDCPNHIKHRKTGQLMRDAMLDFGMGVDPDNLAASIIDTKKYYAFLELHVEQGRSLLDSNLPLSIVTDIAGIKQFYITIKGVAAHAGGMAMEHRHDALVAASAVACEVERLALTTSPTTRGTVGFIESEPGEHNIISEKCVVPVDYREVNDDNWENIYKNLIEFTDTQCKKRGLTWSVHTALDCPPAHCSPKIIDCMRKSANAINAPDNIMISYPAHDAHNMSRIMPIGMIFLRSSNNGLSHCPDEYTTKEDLGLGTQLLYETLVRLANSDETL